MFTSILVVPDVGTVSLYLWAMSSSIQGISVFIRASILMLIFIVGSVAKRNIGMFLSFRVFGGGGGGRGRREVQNDIKPMMNPIELPLLNKTILNPGISTTPNDPSNELGQTLWSMAAPLRYVVPSN
jgi:hypothetical protein